MATNLPAIEWGAWREDVDWAIKGHRYLGLHFESEPFAIGPLIFIAYIVEQHRADESGRMGLIVTAECDGRVLAQIEDWRVDLEGFPHDEVALAFLHVTVSDMVRWAQHQAHVAVRKSIAEHEREGQRLSDIARVMGRIELQHGETSRVWVSLDQAHAILTRIDSNIPRPFRLEATERPDIAVAYGENGQELGRIGFDPTNEQLRKQVGRYGLYVVGPEANNHEKA